MPHLVLFLCITTASGFSLFNLQTSFVEFEPLHANADGVILVGFRFKTYVNAGLLFYVDDMGEGNYLTLYINRKLLVFEMREKTGKTLKITSTYDVNDLRWHKIDLKISKQHVMFKLNNEVQAVFNITNSMKLKSATYFGGISNHVGLFSLSHDEIKFKARFLGCIEDLYLYDVGRNSTDISSPKVLSSSAMDNECKDACKLNNSCQNNGVCVNRFAMSDCLCESTGYYGKFCEKELPVVGLTPEQGVIFDILSSNIKTALERTDFFIRVRSSQRNGEIFSTAHKGDYLRLEFYNGRIAVTVNLGSGSVTIVTNKNFYNDNQWHNVRLERARRMVNLTVDDSDRASGKTEGSFDKFHLPSEKTSFTLGGRKNFNNFEGCLQEFVFNGYHVILNYNKSSDGISARGKFLKSCPFPKKASTNDTRLFLRNTPFITKTFSPTIVTNETLLASKLLSVTSPLVRTHVTSITDVPLESSDYHADAIDQLQTILASTSKPIPVLAYMFYESSPSSGINDQNINIFLSTVKRNTKGVMLQKSVEVLTISSNERKEGDLTIHYIICALVVLLALVVASLIILRARKLSKRKYALRRQSSTQDYWADTGTLQQKQAYSVIWSVRIFTAYFINIALGFHYFCDLNSIF